jgi:diguanylate cyclase (GGDEF)-like protein
MYRLPFILFIFSLFSLQHLHAKEIDLINFETSPIGKYLTYFPEANGMPLTLAAAKKTFDLGATFTQNGQTISRGIKVEPTWFKATIDNRAFLSTEYRLTVEAPWLDYIDVYLVNASGEVKHVSGGDHLPMQKQPILNRFFTMQMQFDEGTTELYIRIATDSVMAVPIKLSTVEDAINDDASDKFQYGFLYGILAALALYNLVLFFSIRKKVFGLYVLYILGFVFNSLSYTGYFHTFYTVHHGVYFQDYMDISLMISYTIIGLHFGRLLLDTHKYAPKLNQAITHLTYIIPFVILTLLLFNQLHYGYLVALIFNISFAVLTITLGVLAVKAKVGVANLYLISSVVAAVCVSVSTSAVAGLLPYNSFTFKAIEVGMAFEGILLAVALATRFRDAQRDKEQAEDFARTDELTSIFNRRGFKHSTTMSFSNFRNNNENFAFLLLDIDRFKRVNDDFGHATGDLVIIQIANLISKTIRKNDVVARWGGEEFIVLLPVKNEVEALRVAEDIRAAIEQVETRYFDERVKVTASIGVCVTKFDETNLHKGDTELFEKLISKADEALYQAKSNGRNNVCIYNNQTKVDYNFTDKAHIKPS